VEDAVRRVLQGEKTAFEMAYQHPTGKNLGWQIILNPIQEADDSVRRFVGIISDVTERQRAEAISSTAWIWKPYSQNFHGFY